MATGANEGMLTDKYLQDIAKQIGNEWRGIGISLGLTNKDLEHLRADHSNSVDCTLKMLVKWRDDKGACVKTLMKALNDMERKDLSDIIEKSTMHLPQEQMPQEATESVKERDVFVASSTRKDDTDTTDNMPTQEMACLSVQKVKPGIISKCQEMQCQGSSGIVTDEVIEKVVKKVGVEWRQLGVSLQLPVSTLEKLEKDHYGATSNCIRAMLVHWRGDPVTGTSLAVLCAALVDVGRNDVAKFIATQDNGGEKPGSSRVTEDDLNANNGNLL